MKQVVIYVNGDPCAVSDLTHVVPAYTGYNGTIIFYGVKKGGAPPPVETDPIPVERLLRALDDPRIRGKYSEVVVR